MIKTSGLTKRFGSLTAVDDVSLDVREGDRYGLLGPNGSGKTTLVRMVLGLVFATGGTIEVMGRPMPRRAKEVLPHVGTLVESPSAYGHLSGRANLAMLDAAGGVNGIAAGDGRIGPRGRRARKDRIERALERVGLGGVDRRPVRAYSFGMRQRLGLAAALLHSPRLLVLDEPTNGLDPQGIKDVRGLLEELNAAGTTIFLCSHLLGEVEQLCTRVGVMDRGRLVLQEGITGLRAPTGRVVVRTPDADRAPAVLGGLVEERAGDRLVVRGRDPAELNALLVGAGLRVTEIRAERRTLEAVVLEVSGHGSDRIDRPTPAHDLSGPAESSGSTGTGSTGTGSTDSSGSTDSPGSTGSSESPESARSAGSARSPRSAGSTGSGTVGSDESVEILP
jgi:ABC-type multidrug transport system ATPase subunit